MLKTINVDGQGGMEIGVNSNRVDVGMREQVECSPLCVVSQDGHTALWIARKPFSFASFAVLPYLEKAGAPAE